MSAPILISGTSASSGLLATMAKAATVAFRMMEFSGDLLNCPTSTAASRPSRWLSARRSKKLNVLMTTTTASEANMNLWFVFIGGRDWSNEKEISHGGAMWQTCWRAFDQGAVGFIGWLDVDAAMTSNVFSARIFPL